MDIRQHIEYARYHQHCKGWRSFLLVFHFAMNPHLYEDGAPLEALATVVKWDAHEFVTLAPLESVAWLVAMMKPDFWSVLRGDSCLSERLYAAALAWGWVEASNPESYGYPGPTNLSIRVFNFSIENWRVQIRLEIEPRDEGSNFVVSAVGKHVDHIECLASYERANWISADIEGNAREVWKIVDTGNGMHPDSVARNPYERLNIIHDVYS